MQGKISQKNAANDPPSQKGRPGSALPRIAQERSPWMDTCMGAMNNDVTIQEKP
jgi:hypothetical protein